MVSPWAPCSVHKPASHPPRTPQPTHLRVCPALASTAPGTLPTSPGLRASPTEPPSSCAGWRQPLLQLICPPHCSRHLRLLRCIIPPLGSRGVCTDLYTSLPWKPRLSVSSPEDQTPAPESGWPPGIRPLPATLPLRSWPHWPPSFLSLPTLAPSPGPTHTWLALCLESSSFHSWVSALGLNLLVLT